MEAHPINGWWTEPAATLLRITGEDAAAFLQSQCTQDLRGPVGLARYTLLLNHKGQVEADAWILKTGEQAFLCYSRLVPAERLRAKLERHIIADDVELADLSATARLLWATPGPAAAALAGALGQDKAPAGSFVALANSRAYLHAAHLFGEGSAALLLLAGEPPQPAAAAPGADAPRWLQAPEAEFARIAAGVPAVPADLDGASLPLLGGAGQAISHTKGCYLGQEVVARLYRLQRQSTVLARVFTDTALQAGDAVVSGEGTDAAVAAGVISSSARHPGTGICAALARVRRKALAGPLSCRGIQLQFVPLD